MLVLLPRAVSSVAIAVSLLGIARRRCLMLGSLILRSGCRCRILNLMLGRRCRVPDRLVRAVVTAVMTVVMSAVAAMHSAVMSTVMVSTVVSAMMGTVVSAMVSAVVSAVVSTVVSTVVSSMMGRSQMSAMVRSGGNAKGIAMMHARLMSVVLASLVPIEMADVLCAVMATVFTDAVMIGGKSVVAQVGMLAAVSCIVALVKIRRVRRITKKNQTVSFGA